MDYRENCGECVEGEDGCLICAATGEPCTDEAAEECGREYGEYLRAGLREQYD